MRTVGAARHSTSSGLAERELYAPGEDLRIDVRSVGLEGPGVRLSLKVWGDGFLSCPMKLVVVRRGDGTVLGHKYVQTEGYSVMGLKSGLVPCTATIDLRVQPASRETALRFELYEGDVSIESVRQSEIEGVKSPSYLVSDLADIAEQSEPKDEGSFVGSTVDSAIGSTVRPIIKWGTGLMGMYLVVDNREMISDIVRDLFTTNGADANG
jgi:hypothetical protein